MIVNTVKSWVLRTSDWFLKHISKKNELHTCSQKELCNGFINMSVLFSVVVNGSKKKYIIMHSFSGKS